MATSEPPVTKTALIGRAFKKLMLSVGVVAAFAAPSPAMAAGTSEGAPSNPTISTLPTPSSIETWYCTWISVPPYGKYYWCFKVRPVTVTKQPYEKPV